MNELQTARMPLHEIDAGNAAVVNLLEELLEICTTLVPNPCIGEKATTGATLVDAQAQVDVLAETHGRETAQLPVEAATDAQVEGAWIEPLVHLLLAATNASCSQEGSHAVADSLLHRRKTLVSPVWSPPGIAFLPFLLIFNGLQKSWRQDTIAVEEDEKVALAPFCCIVARRSRPAVFLRVIAEWQLSSIFVYDTLARLA